MEGEVGMVWVGAHERTDRQQHPIRSYQRKTETGIDRSRMASV